MKNFIIYAPPYDPDSGGAIVLYKLAAVLKSLGYKVSIWHINRPLFREIGCFSGLKKYLKYLKGNLLRYKSYTSPYNLNYSSEKLIKNSIVVYPEIVSGNPLNAKYVVRWLLNKPGIFTNEIDYGKDDLFFFFLEQFRDSSLNVRHESRLNVIEFNKNVYMQKNFKKRTGMCVMVRKGKDRILDQHDVNAVMLDGMTHEEIAEVFNRCKYFVSYDLYTMYSTYAALCGCLPIVVPKPGMSKEEWQPREENRYGVAYSWKDLDWARETREHLIKYIDDCEDRSIQSVREFVEIVDNLYR